MKKRLKILGIGILLLLVGGSIFVYVSVPSLSAEEEVIIESVMASELPELRGEVGFAMNDDTRIWYESINPKDSVKGTFLVVMGISNDALAWPSYFIDSLVAKGYRVVRFDNRGTGMTDWVEDWEGEGAYALEDMAEDGMVVLNELGIDQAHVLGVSLGGMIAQSMAIEFPERVLTLTSMMSSGHITDENLPAIGTDVLADLVMANFRYGIWKSEENEIRLLLTARKLLMGAHSYELNTREIATSILYNLRKRKGYNPDASEQQGAAVMKSGSRYEALEKLSIPTLIVHGKSDPLIPFAHGKKCAEIIPNADFMSVEGMGHDIPPVFSDQIIDRIIRHVEGTAMVDEAI